MKDQRKLGSLLAYVQWGINVLIGIIYTPIMLRYLGQNEYGVYSVATAVISFLTMLDLGFGQTLVRFDVKYRTEGKAEKAQKCSGAFLSMSSLLGVLALVIGLVLAQFMLPAVFGRKFTLAELDILRRVLIILVINLALSFPLSVFSSLITAHERFVFGKVVNILTTLLTYGGILILLVSGYRSVAMAAVTTIVSLVLKLFMAWYCLCRMKVKIRFGRPDKEMLHSIFAFSFFVFLNILIDQLYSSTDKFILGAFCGSAAVTVYTVGVQFNGYFQQLSTAISGVFLPRITKMYSENHDGSAFSPMFIRIGRLQFILLSFVLTGFIAFGQQFIILLGGEENALSYYIALIIMLPGIVPLSQNIGIPILQAMNLHKYRSIAYFVLALLNVAISIPLAIKWSGIGAAIGTSLACFAGQYALMNRFYRKKVGLDISGYWKNIGSITLRTLPMAIPAVLINMFIPGTGWLMLIIKCAVFTLIYLPYCRFCILNDYERDLAAGLLRKLGGQK